MGIRHVLAPSDVFRTGDGDRGDRCVDATRRAARARAATSERRRARRPSADFTPVDASRAGLQNAGKTSFIDALGGGEFKDDMIPTVGFNMRKLRRDGVGVKTWDLGGQERFRGTWERYCRGMHCVVFVLDASAPELFESAKNELHGLLKRDTLKEIPLLVLGNKSDVAGAVKVNEVIEAMELKRVTGREVCCYNVSCKNSTNIDACLKWLTSHAP